MDDSRDAQRIRLRPHVEAHGLYSIEWSYHFPLSPGLRIESQIDVDFPGEKVPGAARVSLRDANLSTTRLSFADTAATARAQSLRFLKDTLGVRASVEGGGDAAALLKAAREHWTQAFFARLGIVLQSDLKARRNSLRELLRTGDPTIAEQRRELAQRKGEVLQAFRSAGRLVRARLAWEGLLVREQGGRASGPAPASAAPLPLLVSPAAPAPAESAPHAAPSADTQALLRFLQQVRDVAELALSLASASVAELQETLVEALKLVAERRAMLRASHLGDEGDAEFEGRLRATEAFLQAEKRWLSEWARFCNDQRLLCGLPSLVDIAADASLAALYYERVRQLKKAHYHVWDLDVELRANDSRIDFWIGAGAAGISAFFAFAAFVFFNLNQTPATQQGLLTLLVFAVANSGIYIAKDRLKEWLKLNLRTVLQLRTGRWMGRCLLRRDAGGPSAGTGKETAPLEVATLERETWWTRLEEDWTFHVWEEFRISPEAGGTDARIVKQVWRLPLDEILHTLDNTRHTLKIPSPDGEPRLVPVLKHTEFPFRLRVRVKNWTDKRLEVVDTAYVIGRVDTAGDHIVALEIIDEAG